MLPFLANGLTSQRISGHPSLGRPGWLDGVNLLVSMYVAALGAVTNRGANSRNATLDSGETVRVRINKTSCGIRHWVSHVVVLAPDMVYRLSPLCLQDWGLRPAPSVNPWI